MKKEESISLCNSAGSLEYYILSRVNIFKGGKMQEKIAFCTLFLRWECA